MPEHLVLEQPEKFSTLQVIFWFEKQENVLIRVLICGPERPVWVAGFVPALVNEVADEIQDRH